MLEMSHGTTLQAIYVSSKSDESVGGLSWFDDRGLGGYPETKLFVILTAIPILAGRAKKFTVAC